MQDEFFHEGEMMLQSQVGLRERVKELGRRAFHTELPDFHRAFFSSLPTIHIGAIDSAGHPCATIRSGAPGFISSPSPDLLEIHSVPLRGEPADLSLYAGCKVSVVGVDYAQQRRNRMNGTLIEAAEGMLRIKVDLSFGNCPQYIAQQSHVRLASTKGETRSGHRLGEPERLMIEQSRMFFIASRAPELTPDPRDGVDVNHRGGRPGFVRVVDDDLIEFHDYPGNNFFQTLGNIALDNRIGLQFVDLVSGDLLWLKGAAKVDTKSEQDTPQSRIVKVRISETTYSKCALPHRYAVQQEAHQAP